MSAIPLPMTRRPVLAALAAAAWLAACGGGGGTADPTVAPAVIEFSADRAGFFVGESPRISIRFAGAQARIEPGIGPVASGSVVTLPPLADARTLRLVVQTPGLGSAERELLLPVRWRDRWQPIDAPAVSWHAATVATDGSLIISGGSRGEGVISDAIERYDADAQRFVRIGTLASGRVQHSAVALADGGVLVAGGLTALPLAPFAERVDPRTGAVTPAGTMLRPRLRHAALRLADGRVLVVGGVGTDGAEIWDPRTNAWRAVGGRMAHEREHASATLLADGRVLVAGGASGAADYVFAEIFDPRTEVFTPLPSNVTQRRQFHAARRLADGSVVVIGGDDSETGAPVATVLRFVPVGAAGGWFAEAPLATARTLAALVDGPADELLLVGGQTEAEPATAVGAAWRLGGAQRALAPMPGARIGHSANRLADGRVIVVGGEDGRGEYAAGAAIYD
jgi:hypothetical protein